VRRTVLAVLALALAPLAAAEPVAVVTVTPSFEGGAPQPGRWATLLVSVTVEEGWHVNSNAPRDPYLVPTTVTVNLPSGWRAEPPQFPHPRLAKFSFSDERVSVFDGRFVVRVRVLPQAGAEWPAALTGTVTVQACNDQQCLPPTTLTFALPLSGPPLAATSGAAPAASPPAGEAGMARSESPFAGRTLLVQLLLAFLAGLALNLTPCVYPLIPITVGFFAGQPTTGRRGVWPLAVAYVLGMAVTYSTLGVLAALTGRLFGAALQSPWVVGLLAALMLALAASMFGLWELRVPAWATRVSGGRSGLGGALIMGLVVGVVAAPCIGPFVLGLLTYVGQRQDVLLGFSLFFALALGLGIPYLLLALSTSLVQRLPASGAWMLGVRQLFGVLLVGLAAYFVAPLLPEPWGQRVLAITLGLGGAYLLLVARPGHEHPVVDRFMRLSSAALLLGAAWLWPRPAASERVALAWQGYDAAQVEAAIAAGGPVVLDFYADWCLPCKELDRNTFSDPEVAARLASFSRFKVNLTTSNAETEALQARYRVAGVPTVAFFLGGVEVAPARLTGFEEPRRFLKRLDLVAAQRR
jgi:thiol:disulfide interchange protein DsbD